MTARSALPSAQHGMTLIEVLMSILIFSIAIIGLLGVQAWAVKTSVSSKQRADASYLANQIIGQIWADRTNIAAYSHYPVAGASPCSPSGAASANPNVLAWLGAVQAALPGASANQQQIVVGANNVVAVTVCWQLPGEPAQHNVSETAEING